MIGAKVLADSVNWRGCRLTTLAVTMPRIILAEFNTHRVFSRNSASSRAIPVAKRIAAVERATFVPVLTEACTGMVSNTAVASDLQQEWEQDVIALRDSATAFARKWSERGHKQHVNRYLEPFSYTTVVVSATEWANFFAQRCHPDAQPEIRAVAELMRDAMRDSLPYFLKDDEWHLPFITSKEKDSLHPETAKLVSVARCARVSYLTHDGERDIGADVSLAHKLLASRPPHASPFEHVARPMGPREQPIGNFVGWMQLRHVLLAAPDE